MKVLRVISSDIAKQIESMSKKSHRLEFALDGNGELVISKNVLNDPNFLEIQDLLINNSEEIEYVPVPNND